MSFESVMDLNTEDAVVLPVLDLEKEKDDKQVIIQVTEMDESDSDSDSHNECQSPVIPVEILSSAVEQPYSVFTLWQKRLIVLAASIGSFISPLTTNIYLPALNTIGNDLGIGTSKVYLTVTFYMLSQGIAPAFLGSFSDTIGRRPAYIASLVMYIGANIGLALQKEYVSFLVLRCLQAIGSSTLTVLASGIVSDCVTSSERGSFVGYMSVGTILGPSLSPLLGGLLSQYLGWRSIFWFLTIFGSVYLVAFIFFFPETCRRLVKDGSVPPPVHCRTLVSLFRRREQTEIPKSGGNDSSVTPPEIHRPQFSGPGGTIRMLADKETALIILYSSLVYAGYYALVTSITSQFGSIYGYNDLAIGLCFIPISVGGILATLSISKWDPIDGNYRRHARRLGLGSVKSIQHDLTNFPIERARIEIMGPLFVACSVLVPIYGWMLNAMINVAGPLVLLTMLGFCVASLAKTNQVLLIDLKKDEPATVMAAFNLLSSLFGAGGVAGINPLIKEVGNGWASTIIASVWLLHIPMLILVWKKGPQWRRDQAIAREQKAAATKV